MINIGLTSWGEHRQLFQQQAPLTLNQYAQYFPIVEVDTLFYGLKTAQQISHWQEQVPAEFQFIIKAHQAITLHRPFTAFKMSPQELISQFKLSLKPLIVNQQLKTILLQFGPSFQLTQKSLRYLQFLRTQFEQLPIAVEFRHRSWYDQNYQKQLTELLQRLKFVAVMADEPQTPGNSVPFRALTEQLPLCLMRLHGRNYDGWYHASQPNWRQKRTAYCYTTKELQDIRQQVIQKSQINQEVCVIFNNNAQQDAADNALILMEMLELDYQNLAPKSPQQLDLFS